MNLDIPNLLGVKSSRDTSSGWLKNSYFIFAQSLFKGKLSSIRLHRCNAGIDDSWFVEHVSVDHRDGDESHFPLSRWIPANIPMHFDKYDSQLPQYVKKHQPKLYQQRVKELERKKIDFAYTPADGVKGMPRTVSNLLEHAFYKNHIGFRS